MTDRKKSTIYLIAFCALLLLMVFVSAKAHADVTVVTPTGTLIVNDRSQCTVSADEVICPSSLGFDFVDYITATPGDNSPGNVSVVFLDIGYRFDYFGCIHLDETSWICRNVDRIFAGDFE